MVMTTDDNQVREGGDDGMLTSRASRNNGTLRWAGYFWEAR